MAEFSLFTVNIIDLYATLVSLCLLYQWFVTIDFIIQKFFTIITFSFNQHIYVSFKVFVVNYITHNKYVRGMNPQVDELY